MTFDEWLGQRLDPLLGFAVVLCGDRHLAEDVVQDVLVKAQKGWDRIQAADRPEGYLRRMVVNEYLTWRRKWARIVPRAEIMPTGHQADPADNHADREELIAELSKLPRRQRTVLVLRYYCGQSDAEIAEMLGCSAGSVRTYASRALGRLRVEMVGTRRSAPGQANA